MAAVSFCTGGPGGDANLGILQKVDAVLGGNAGDREAKNVRCLMATVDVNLVKFF